MPDNAAPVILPCKRTGGLLAWLDRKSIAETAALGILCYIAVVFWISVVEFILHVFGYEWVVSTIDDKSKLGLADILYFNSTTILTVGYGDFRPDSLGKLLSVFEAFFGVGLFGVLLSVLTVKLLLPPRNAVVFSRFAYYCTAPERFMIIFVNTSNANLGNVEISSYFKLEGDWHLRPAVTAPFITQSVQTFYLDRLNRDELIKKLRDGDCLRIGLTAGLGFTSFSTSIQYYSEEILVIPDRSALIKFFEPLKLPDFTHPALKGMFHYQPENAVNLRDYVRQETQSS